MKRVKPSCHNIFIRRKQLFKVQMFRYFWQENLKIVIITFNDINTINKLISNLLHSIWYSAVILLGILPTEWKLARVELLYKTGNEDDHEKHRLVTLTSIGCKIREKSVPQHLVECRKAIFFEWPVCFDKR